MASRAWSSGPPPPRRALWLGGAHGVHHAVRRRPGRALAGDRHHRLRRRDRRRRSGQGAARQRRSSTPSPTASWAATSCGSRCTPRSTPPTSRPSPRASTASSSASDRRPTSFSSARGRSGGGGEARCDGAVGSVVEGDQAGLLDRGGRCAQGFHGGGDRVVEGPAVDAGRDQRERDGSGAELVGDGEGARVAGGQQGPIRLARRGSWARRRGSPSAPGRSRPSSSRRHRWRARWEERRMQSSSTAGPPRRWIAPSTPPPPRIARLAALTTASTDCSVMSPRTTVTGIRRRRIAVDATPRDTSAGTPRRADPGGHQHRPSQDPQHGGESAVVAGRGRVVLPATALRAGRAEGDGSSLGAGVRRQLPPQLGRRPDPQHRGVRALRGEQQRPVGVDREPLALLLAGQLDRSTRSSPGNE